MSYVGSDLINFYLDSSDRIESTDSTDRSDFCWPTKKAFWKSQIYKSIYAYQLTVDRNSNKNSDHGHSGESSESSDENYYFVSSENWTHNNNRIFFYISDRNYKSNISESSDNSDNN